jgi:20S proteasome alpha/beta subunit
VTCVVGLIGKKGVLLAGDSQSSTEWIYRYDTGTKVFKLSPVLAIAYCGSGRFGQILQFHLRDSLDDPPLQHDLRYWVVRNFIPYLRGETEAHGHLHIHHNVEEFGPSAFLLAARDRLFSIENDFSVNENIRPFEALGSGGETAMGALTAEADKTDIGDEPIADSKLEAMARRAITAAARTTNYVGGPIRFEKTEIYTHDEREQAKDILAGRATYRGEDY